MPSAQTVANYQAWQTLLLNAYVADNVPLAPAVFPAGATPAQTGTHDTPDANGNVALTGLVDPVRAAKRYCVKEIADSLPAGSLQRGTAEANVSHANGEWIVGQQHFIGVCLQVVGVNDPATGGTTFVIQEPPFNVPGTIAMPPVMVGAFDLSTVAGTIAYLNSLPLTNSNPGAPGFAAG